MIEGLPFYITATFVITTVATIWFLVRSIPTALRESLPFRLLLFLIPFWLLLTGFLSTSNFYRSAEAFPPRIPAFAVMPAVLLILGYFLVFRRGFIDVLSLRTLTLLHVIRFPVEIVLHWLHESGQVPVIMTYEGWNFDILSGLSAPLIYWIAFRNQKLNRPLLILWNILALGLLINIVSIAVLSFPSVIQRFAFYQPNIGLTYLPFIWLASMVVPIVLFAHLASLWQLTVGRTD
ncbi:MAG: hypothetical protein ABIR33_06140 [Pyrinomonadaceae bacterium]